MLSDGLTTATGVERRRLKAAVDAAAADAGDGISTSTTDVSDLPDQCPIIARHLHVSQLQLDVAHAQIIRGHRSLQRTRLHRNKHLSLQWRTDGRSHR